MIRTLVSAAVLVAILGSIGYRHGGVMFAGIPISSTGATERLEDKLDRVANDPSAKRSDRAAAVFGLFKRYLKPGDSLERVRRVLRHTGWVEEARLCYFAILGGWIPVDMNFEDRTYSLHLFADHRGQSDWVIYLQLAGRSEWGKWNEDGIAFLHGKAGSMGESRIKEFALCYPDGRIEIFKGN